jgi:quinolinate synthase
MAETAKILSPDKKVLIPDLDAGCSLASAVTAEDVRRWRDEHPDALVVSYVNTSAEVKAESDICCTSSNAVDVVRALPEDREILFLPDMFLGAHVERQTGRKMHLWMAECHVHAGIGAQEMQAKAAADPDAETGQAAPFPPGRGLRGDRPRRHPGAGSPGGRTDGGHQPRIRTSRGRGRLLTFPASGE